MSFVSAHCLLTGRTPAADLTSLSQEDSGGCGIFNTEEEPPNIFLSESDLSDVGI